MKTTFKLLFLLLLASKSFAQNIDKVLARVRYTYVNQTDTATHKGKARVENMILFLGKDVSLYTSYDKITYEISEDQKSRARAIARVNNSSAPTLVKIDRSAGEWLSKTNYFQFTKAKKTVTIESIIGTGYLVEEVLPNLDWKITKDTLTLSGIMCQKAIANYEGKNWTAWFAPSLPFQSGPWKLQGLPGLILEAFDDQKTIQFQFAGFEKAKEGDFARANDIRKSSGDSSAINTVDVMLGLDVAGAYFENNLSLPTYRTIKTTRKELDKLKEAYAKDPKGFMKTQFGY